VHTWEISSQVKPVLASWSVTGLVITPAQALVLLVNLPSLDTENHLFTAGDDARYWHKAAALAMETLAAQKLAPTLVRGDPDGKRFYSRWTPVLDGPKDALRLGQLQAAMPPVCRAAVSPQGVVASARSLLLTFLNSACDDAARRWAKSAAPRFAPQETGAEVEWVQALFREDPQVKVSPAQGQALETSYRAWMRNLHMAGDAYFRVAFRLDTPKDVEKDKASWKIHFLLQARDDPTLLIPAEQVWKTSGNALLHMGRRFEQPQEKMLGGLGYAARLFAPVQKSLKAKRPDHLVLDTQGAYDFLRNAAPLLEEAGFGLLAPPWWNQPGTRLGMRLRLMPPAGKAVEALNKGQMRFQNLVNYQWELSLGETSLTEQEFRALAALKSPLVQVHGQWVQLDPEQVEAAIQFWKEQASSGEMTLIEALQFGLGGRGKQHRLPVADVVAEGWVGEWLDRLRQPDRLSELEQPAALQGQLRPYQLFGYSWLYFLRRYRLGACLADDMGLGKTIQTIAMLLKEKEMLGLLPAPTLLVCPTSVVTNWEREIRRFAPSLTTLVHQGAGRLRSTDFHQAVRSVDMVLTSYVLARQDTEMLQSVDWLGVILDEAQNIKNPAAKQTQAVNQLKADFRLALTGTPVENRLSELWSIMQFLNPGYLGAQQSFRSQFALPIERYADQEAAQKLRKIAGPFILRRVKSDPNVIQDLPEKIEVKDYCTLTEEQATLYEAVVQEAMRKVENSDGIQRRGLVLSMLMQLKQICNHPAQYLHVTRQPGGIESLVDQRASLAGRSGKLERLAEMLDEILTEGNRALIFTQFAEMGELLSIYLPEALGCAAMFLHGGTPVKARDQMVRRFQEDEHAPPLFILSLKAGGIGLNLTRANHVFHFDRWWNPAVEDQATDRAYRIGQQVNVQVHKFVTTGTLEEMIDEMIESKKGLAEAIVGGGEEWLTELSTDELRTLVQLRRT
jgi:SNF2 family DNA or RNA helicase